ncbi:putative disease resistance RPP13-like protein 1 [Prosopis cineraria]|uniref:putative disease resistance RPP13-like protein 1 n=1 Tax=Prosopis cineraria TaxID=364024 RepID=UPI00240EEBD6|nr:putative disease resistance RPP13-like protein 1 [Prosopis cineraria]
MLPNDMQDLVNLRHLDVRNTGLKEMPRGLGKLKNLQFLSDFVVGKEQGINIGELGAMKNLKGWVAINKLENVKNGNEAYEARMTEKKHIKDLTLSWSKDDGVDDTRYRGTAFPDWLGSPRYHNVTWFRLDNCKNCCMLPPLGQLPALRRLYIEGLESIEKIGEEFLKAGVPKLRIIDRWMWKCGVGGKEKELPASLRKLEITGCRMLESMSEALSKHLRLQELGIWECSNTSHQMIHLPPSLQRLTIHICPNVNFVLSSTAPLQNLQSIAIQLRCNFVKFMSDDMEHLLPNLKDLWITLCQEMEAFPEGILVPNVNCFPEGFSLPATLTTLQLSNFRYLETLDCTGLEHLTSLQQLNVRGCPKLEKMSGEKLPYSLRELRISGLSIVGRKLPQGG